MNRFAEALGSGRFVLTCELECPRHAGAANVERQARTFAPLVDAVNCTDNSAAVVRMSPVAAAAIAARAGATPLVQLTTRDRNRLALQSEILGAAAVGAVGIVCMRGDPIAAGNHPDGRAVFDLDTLGLLRTVQELNAGRFLSGDPVRTPPDLVVGVVTTPQDRDDAVEELRAKVEAGAAFVQTQIGYDLALFERWLARLRGAGLTERLHILAGVAPIKSRAVARYLHEEVPGVSLPDDVLRRLERAADVEAEGVAIAGELLRAYRQMPNVAGAHIMTFGWVGGVARVLAAAG